MTSRARFIVGAFAIGVLCAMGPAPAPAADVSAQDAALSLTAAELAPHVTIRRDSYGVPHILADNDEAAGFALGYAQAEDHAVEMGKLYVEARGEGARWFGRSSLENDFAMKRLHNLEGARAIFAESGPGFQRWLHCFITGFNLYGAQHKGELPEWFPVITEADLIAYGHEGAVTTFLRPPRGASGAAEGNAAEGDAPAEGTGLAAMDDRAGSNAIAIAGAHTQTGRPMLLANPHLRWASQYWEAQVTVPGAINFYGSLTTGLSALRAGFGETLGYAQTNNTPDLIDHYAVPIDPADPDHYRFKGESRPFQHETVSVDVLGDDGRITTESREFLATDFGPVVQTGKTQVIVARSEEFNAWRYHEGFFDLLRAHDLASFQTIMDEQLIPTSNFTYADAQGNIQYLWNARLPKRALTSVNGEIVDYTGVVPGDDDRYFFQGIHPLSELPRVLNPSSGYVMNSNNAPWFTTVRDRLNPANFPPYVQRGYLSGRPQIPNLELRPQMALTMLESAIARRGRLSADDFRALKFSDHVLLADRVLPDLLAAGGHGRLSADTREGLAILARWDRQAAAKSRGAMLFTAFWDAYEGDRPQPFRVPWSEDRIIETPAGLSDPDGALAALGKTVAALRDKFGRADVAWGEANRFRFGDIDLPGDGASGGYGLYRVVTFDKQGGDSNTSVTAGGTPAARIAANARIAGRPGYGAPIAGFGDGWVLMMNFTTPVTASGVLAYGESSDAASPHSRDQIRLFAEHRLRPIWFSEADIHAHLEREYRPGAAADDLTRVDAMVDSDPGVKIFVREVKAAHAAGSGAPVLLVHDGEAGGLASFDLPNYSLAADLAHGGHAVYIVDVRGFEKSTRPDALDQAPGNGDPVVGLADAARDIAATVDWIGARNQNQKVAILGWGAGGTWAGAYASAHPERVGRLVLLNALYAPGSPWAAAQNCAAVHGSYWFVDGHGLRARWDASLPARGPGTVRDDAVADAYVQRALWLDPTSDSRKPASVRVAAGYMADACAAAQANKPLWNAGALTMPTLVVRSEHDDWSTPDDVAALKQALASRAAVLSLRGADHYVLLDRLAHGRGQFVAETLRFLQ